MEELKKGSRISYRKDANYESVVLECVDCKKEGDVSIAFFIINGRSVCEEHLNKINV